MNKKIKKLSIASFMVIAFSSSSLLITTPALAGSSETCSGTVGTVTLSSSTTGALLPNAAYTVRVPWDTGRWFLAGDKSTLIPTFEQKFNEYLKTITNSWWGKYYYNGLQSTLGTTPVRYPLDITDITDPASQTIALEQWKNDTITQAFKAEVDRRSNGYGGIYFYRNGLDQYDPSLSNEINTGTSNFNRVKSALNTALNTSNWDNFVSSYKTLSDPSLWYYGFSRYPNMKFVDYNNGNQAEYIWNNANKEAAKAIGAENSITVITDANGNATFTIFGVKYTYGDDFTRGDNTCSQLTGEVAQVNTPRGYQVDNSVYTFNTLSDGTLNLSLSNDPQNLTEPEPQVLTDTGLSLKRSYSYF